MSRLPRLQWEKWLSVYNWETAATTVSLCDVFGWWPFPRLSHREMEVLLAVRGRALPYILWGNRVMHLHNPAPETRVKSQDCAPPWGFCHTPMQENCSRIPHTCCKNAKVRGIWGYKHNNMGSLHLEMCIFMYKILCTHAKL